MLSPFAAAYAGEISGGDPGFAAGIDPADEMYRFAFHSLRGSADAAALLYFSIGRLIADTVSTVLDWRFGGRQPRSLLDFAAGFGRATRFLVRRLPPEAITVAEIDPAALAFQERTFGVRTLRSPADADTFRPARTYEAVVASSFFSHLPEERFRPWLEKLWTAVAPGGVLLFSTHGASLLSDAADWSRGIVFRASSETARLDPADYGTTWVTPGFLADAAGRSCPGSTLHHVPFGLDGRQDLSVVARAPHVPEAPPAIPPVPRGELVRIELDGAERLRCEGSLDSTPPAEIVFVVRDEERARTLVGAGDAPRWSFDVSIADVAPDDVLRVEARTASRRRILAMGTLRPFL